jgi:hypothetical protein
MSTGFSCSPSTVNFGNVPASTSAGPMAATLTNIGTTPVNLTIGASDPRFVFTPSGPVTIGVGGNLVVSITFNANAVLGSVSFAWVGFTGLPPLGLYQVTATTVSGGSSSWNVTPSAINFGTLKLGTTVGPTGVTIHNTGGTPLVISSISISPLTDFSLSGVPSLPATIAGGGTLTFGISCTAEFRGLNDYINGLVVTPASGPPVGVELVYTGFVLTPAYVLSGATQGVYYSLAGTWDNSFSTYIAQGLATLGPEANATATKLMQGNQNSDYTYWNRLWMSVEPLGPLEVIINWFGIISNQLAQSGGAPQVRNTTNDATGIPQTMIFSQEMNSDFLKMTLTVLANEGIMSMLNYQFAMAPRGSEYESS